MFELAIFIIVNLAIFLAYATIARFVVPSLNIKYAHTKIGGLFFFALCSLTHLELAIHAITGQPLTVEDFTSWHMLLVHIPQAIAVWVFTHGLYKEVGRKNGSFILRGDRNIIRQLVDDMEEIRKHVNDEDTKLIDEAVRNLERLNRNLHTNYQNDWK